MNPYLDDAQRIIPFAEHLANAVVARFRNNYSRISSSHLEEYFRILGRFSDVVLRFPETSFPTPEYPIFKPSDFPELSDEIEAAFSSFTGPRRTHLETNVAMLFMESGFKLLDSSSIRRLESDVVFRMFYHGLNGDDPGRKVEKILCFAMRSYLLDQHLRLHLSGHYGYNNGIECRQRHRVGDLNGWKIEIYSDEHPPAHFHVKGPDVSFSVGIRDGKIVDGNPSNKEIRTIMNWYSNPGNKKRLVDIWNETRPDGCPVGAILSC